MQLFVGAWAFRSHLRDASARLSRVVTSAWTEWMGMAIMHFSVAWGLSEEQLTR